jgi:hypothetical protein
VTVCYFLILSVPPRSHPFHMTCRIYSSPTQLAIFLHLTYLAESDDGLNPVDAGSTVVRGLCGSIM